MMNFVEDTEYDEFTVTHQVNDQYIRIFFQGDKTDFDCFFWNVAIVVYDNEDEIDANFIAYPRTGRQGMRTLILAKQSILEFETFIQEQYSWAKHTIYAGWHDELRHKVYERGLLSAGYVYGQIPLDKSQDIFFVKQLF